MLRHSLLLLVAYAASAIALRHVCGPFPSKVTSPSVRSGRTLPKQRYKALDECLEKPPEQWTEPKVRDTVRIGRRNKPRVRRRSTERITVTNVHELRDAILGGFQLKDIDLKTEVAERDSVTNRNSSAGNAIKAAPPSLGVAEQPDEAGSLMSHEVLKLIEYRARTKSTPGNRHETDTARLALAIEGGGMRGAICAGMAAAVASLDLCDAFDVVYGSSAGCIVGAYMLSRQICMDVYGHLCTAKKTFLCKHRMMASLVVTITNQFVSKVVARSAMRKRMLSSILSAAFGGTSEEGFRRNLRVPDIVGPGMNISFVLDGIMSADHGLRPFDLETFQQHDAKQPLRVVASSVRGGKLETVAFGSEDGDFFAREPCPQGKGKVVTESPAQSGRRGLFACLQASMAVPGATGPPVKLVRGKHRASIENEGIVNATSFCFDAFCYEPVPYRSAVEEGATHVVAFLSRPTGFPIQTQPGVYEKIIAPSYFRSHGLHSVAKYFEHGGQQYRYLEDIMTLDEGLRPGCNATTEGVLVPPTRIEYGLQSDENECRASIEGAHQTWRRAHLLPIVTPRDAPELSTLAQDEEEVLQAVRNGYAAAFNVLAPVIGIDLDSNIDGQRVAELIFPMRPSSVRAESDEGDRQEKSTNKLLSLIRRRRRKSKHRSSAKTRGTSACSCSKAKSSFASPHSCSQCQRQASEILSILPGVQPGKFSSLADGLFMLERSRA